VRIVLPPECASRVRAVLGDGVDLSPAAVPHVLARLAEQAPDAYSEVLNRLSGSEILLDSERALHRRHRLAALRRLLFGWGEYQSDAGDRLVAKRRVAAALPVALAALLLVTAGLGALLHRPHSGSRPRASARSGRPAASVPHERAPVQPAAVRRPRLWPAPWNSTGLQTAAPPPSPHPTLSLPPVPPLAVPPAPALPRADASVPPAVVFTAAPPESGTARRPDSPPRSPVVYARDAAGDTDDAAEPTADTAGRAARAAAAAPPRIGDRLAAHLATGIAVAPGVPPVPVIVEAADGSTWLGRAAAQGDGRISIAVDNAGPAASGVPASAAPPPARHVGGVVLEPDRLLPGLPARAVVRRRQLAAAVIGAAAQAASDYMQALARAAQLSVADGTAQVSVGGAAPAWTYAVSRVADLLAPQAPGGTVETLEVPAGTPCLILVTEAP
jgi:hypothetical protein